jgi:hypothetical protein
MMRPVSRREGSRHRPGDDNRTGSVSVMSMVFEAAAGKEHA